jgi:hypothetical protein
MCIRDLQDLHLLSRKNRKKLDVADLTMTYHPAVNLEIRLLDPERRLLDKTCCMQDSISARI